jgi:tetratricopeptide (TPR) repeat protein
MVAQNKADPHFSRVAFFSDHPAEEERAANNAKWAAQILPTRTDWVTNEDAYHAATAPFIRRWIEEELGLGQPDRSIVMFRRLAANMPSQGLYQYGLGEAYRKRNQKNDAAAAENAYRGALACPDAPAEAWRGLGLLEMRTGDTAKAKQAFTQYQAKMPDASDKAMIDFYLSQL